MDKYPVSDEIRDQIRKAEMILDETHIAMGGTGKRVDQLERKVSALEAELAQARAEIRDMTAKWASVAIERDAAVADAERYRWLCEDHANANMRARVRLVAGSISISGKGYTDAAIDAARAKESGNG